MKHSLSNGAGTVFSGFEQMFRRLSLLLNKKRTRQLIIILKKIIQVFGINLVFYINKWKLKRVQGANIRINDIMPWLKESTILILLNILYPTLKKVQFLKSDYVHWTSMVGMSLMLTKGEAPSWIFAHLLVEALYSKLKATRPAQWAEKSLPLATLVKFKQIFVCLAVIVLSSKLDKNSLSFHALFDRRSFLTDFFTINAIFTISTIYRKILKFFFTSGTKTNRKDHNHNFRNFSELLGVKNHADWPISSSNLKHVIDRLSEIHEVTIEDKYTTLNEKIINSGFIKVIFPSLRWTILRQCIGYSFVTKRGKLMDNKLRCIVMLLTFTLVDPTNKMRIDSFFVRSFAKFLTNVYLKRYWHYNFQKYVLFFLFQFSIT